MSLIPAPTGSTILDAGKTPAHWVEVMAGRGIEISERTIRERASKLGACYGRGKAMIITPEQIDTILMEGQPCRLKSIAGGMSGGPKAMSNITAIASPNINAAALVHLQRQARGHSAAPKKIGKSVVTLLETKPS